MKRALLTFIAISLITFNSKANNNQLTTEQNLKEFKNELIYHIDKRFENINRRFEDINKRFEDMNRRFGELRYDMNKRFEQVDKRFEDINKRFDQMIQFLWIITGIFTTLTAVVIGFAYWDRRTIIRRAKEETIEELEREGNIRKLIEVLREKAKTDKELAQILRNFNLL